MFSFRLIYLTGYKKAQLEADLRTAGMDITPELYVSNAIVKAAAIGLLSIPAFHIVKLLDLFIVFVAIVVYIDRYKKGYFTDIEKEWMEKSHYKSEYVVSIAQSFDN